MMKFILRVTLLTLSALILGGSCFYGYLYFSHLRITTELPAPDAVFITAHANTSKISTPQSKLRLEELFKSKDSTDAIILKGKDAEALASLWRNLKFSPFRPLSLDYNFCLCSPAYRLRFMQGDSELLDTTICWQCNNFKTSSGVTAGFDGEHESAMQLLEKLKAILPLSEEKLPSNEAH